MAKNTPPPLQLGPVEITDSRTIDTRMAIELWGTAGCGKSAFAATAPGTKLWLSFGDNEHITVAHRPDVLVANLSTLTVDELFKHGKGENPFGLAQTLNAREDIETVVVDSATALAYSGLVKAINDGVGAGKGFTPSLETPGISAYGARNALTIEVLSGILKVTARFNVHCIVIAHEADATMKKDDRGNATDIIDYISVQLGGRTVNETTWRFSEIWYMSLDTKGGKDIRLIATRPTRKRRPMKTRMFQTNGPAEFMLEYDNSAPDEGQMTITSFYEQWEEGGRLKIPVPDNLRR